MRRGGSSRAAAVVVLVEGVSALAACSQPECEEKADLVAMDGWRLLGAEDDPFSPPADAALCTDDDIRMEPFGVGGPTALDVDTSSGCGWATLEQQLVLPLEAGDAVQLRVFYFSQTRFPAAEAHLAVTLGDDELWSTSVPIPTGSALEAPRIELTDAFATGTPARFHVGNHGDNSWNLLELSRVRKVFCSDD